MTNIQITSNFNDENIEIFFVNGQIINPFEINMIHLLATEDTLPVIAENLKVSINTLEIKKQLLYRKLSVLSRARLIAVCYDKKILIPKL